MEGKHEDVNFFQDLLGCTHNSHSWDELNLRKRIAFNHFTIVHPTDLLPHNVNTTRLFLWLVSFRSGSIIEARGKLLYLQSTTFVIHRKSSFHCNLNMWSFVIYKPQCPDLASRSSFDNNGLSCATILWRFLLLFNRFLLRLNLGETLPTFEQWRHIHHIDSNYPFDADPLNHLTHRITLSYIITSWLSYQFLNSSNKLSYLGESRPYLHDSAWIQMQTNRACGVKREVIMGPFSAECTILDRPKTSQNTSFEYYRTYIYTILVFTNQRLSSTAYSSSYTIQSSYNPSFILGLKLERTLRISRSGQPK